MNKQQLSTKIWSAANVMRGKVDANDYKDYLLGLIFYKYLSENEEKFLITGTKLLPCTPVTTHTERMKLQRVLVIKWFRCSDIRYIYLDYMYHILD